MAQPDPLPYSSLPAFPGTITPGTILARLVAGLGFRLHWATDGLTPADAEFRAHPEGFSIRETLEHVGQLVSWIHAQVCAQRGGVAPLPELDPEHGFQERREHCLRGLAALEEQLSGFEASDLARIVVDHRRGKRPFWVLVNGPLSDALTHVGQISAWRRQAGNPAPGSNPFDGLPPA